MKDIPVGILFATLSLDVLPSGIIAVMDEKRFIAAFPQVINDLMEEYNISGNELASRSGVSQPQVSRILNGTRRISLEQVVKIGAAFGLSGAQLMRRAEDVALGEPESMDG